MDPFVFAETFEPFLTVLFAIIHTCANSVIASSVALDAKTFREDITQPPLPRIQILSEETTQNLQDLLKISLECSLYVFKPFKKRVQKKPELISSFFLHASLVMLCWKLNPNWQVDDEEVFLRQLLMDFLSSLCVALSHFLTLLLSLLSLFSLLVHTRMTI